MHIVRFILLGILIMLPKWSLGQIKYDATLLELPSVNTSMSQWLVRHEGYSASYNEHFKIPNWVAYQLTYLESLGDVPRKRVKFTFDPQIGKAASPTHEDYTNSGYARGHMAPAGDMKWSEKAMLESFYLSNVCPQDPSMNSGIWNRIEMHIRKMMKAWGAVYICCGPIVEKNHETIGESKVAVPSYFFKVLCRKDRKKGEWGAIGFLIPNKPLSAGNHLSDYAVAVDDLEKITGLDFFHNLPNSVERQIEAKFDISFWSIKAK